jgi:pyruvate formate lyase activating enzyme
MSEGLIFDIKKYSINDGPGIRTTVFFKGCPLRCRWCHNPEGQAFTIEIMVRPSRCLKECAECIAVCDEDALSKIGDILMLERSKCSACAKCADVCPAQAIEIAGRRLKASEVVAEIEKDRIFQEESGGGVTFSGGEPLSQPVFLAEILTLCRQKEIHVTVDTCGFAPSDVLDKIAGLADLFLYDLKSMDEAKHREFTGQSNRLVLENLKRLAAKGKRIIIRLPIVSGINDDPLNIQRTAEFLRSLPGVTEISLLPYHKLGRAKYKGLEKRDSGEDLAPPSAQRLEKITKDLESFGFSVRLGE